MFFEAFNDSETCFKNPIILNVVSPWRYNFFHLHHNLIKSTEMLLAPRTKIIIKRCFTKTSVPLSTNLNLEKTHFSFQYLYPKNLELTQRKKNCLKKDNIFHCFILGCKFCFTEMDSPVVIIIFIVIRLFLTWRFFHPSGLYISMKTKCTFFFTKMWIK